LRKTRVKESWGKSKGGLEAVGKPSLETQKKKREEKEEGKAESKR